MHTNQPHIPGAVLPLQTGGYMVASRTTEGAYWLVWVNTCSCPARVPQCWHQRQVAAYVRGLDALRRRPAAPVNVSLMVD